MVREIKDMATSKMKTWAAKVTGNKFLPAFVEATYQLWQLATWAEKLPVRLKLVDRQTWLTESGWNRFVRRNISGWKQKRWGQYASSAMMRNTGRLVSDGVGSRATYMRDYPGQIKYQQIFEDVDGVLIDIETGERFGKSAPSGGRFLTPRRKDGE